MSPFTSTIGDREANGVHQRGSRRGATASLEDERIDFDVSALTRNAASLARLEVEHGGPLMPLASVDREEAELFVDGAGAVFVEDPVQLVRVGATVPEAIDAILQERAPPR